jgi:hypothetical protein
MIKTVFLHIGVHKTGSTSIQESLGKIRDVLISHGYLYPVFDIDGTTINNHSIPLFSLFSKNPQSYHPNISRGYDSMDKIQILHESYKTQFVRQLERFEGENLIISGEDISVLDPEGIENLKNYLIQSTNAEVAIKVILFCRNPITYARSHIQQCVKGGSVLEDEIDAYFSFVRTHYQTRLANFLTAFPKDSITVARYEDAISHQYGLLGGFLSAIRADPRLAKGFDKKMLNKSLSYESIIIINAINKNLPRFKDNAPNPQRSGYRHDLIRRISGTKFDFDAEFNRRIWTESHEDMCWLHENFSSSEYTFNESDVSRNELWSMSVLEQFHTLLPKQPAIIRSIVLSEISLEKERNENHFSRDKINRIERFIVHNSTDWSSRSHINKIVSYYNIFGALPTLRSYKRRFFKNLSKIFKRAGKR